MLRQAGLKLAPDLSFNPKRSALIVPKPKGEEDGLVYTPDAKEEINALGMPMAQNPNPDPNSNPDPSPSPSPDPETLTPNPSPNPNQACRWSRMSCASASE